METRSGDLISGALAFATAASSLTSPPNTQVFKALHQANAMPEWAIIAAVCGLFCMFAAFCDNVKVQALARMMSGCVWGTIVLVLGAGGNFFPLFWTAAVLFSFDVYQVLIKGQSWIQRSNS